jgi:methionine synthase II (cobalamin-independent)
MCVLALWVNLNCGLKTRGWLEARIVRGNMMEAVRQARGRRAGRTP